MRKFACICLILILMRPLVVFADANNTCSMGALQLDLPERFYFLGTSGDDNTSHKTYESHDSSLLITQITGHTCKSIEDATFLCQTYIGGMLETASNIKVTESESVPGSYYSAHVGQRIFYGDLTWCGVFVYATNEHVYMLTYIRIWEEVDGAGDEFYNIYKSAKYDGVLIYNEIISPIETIDNPASSPKTIETIIDLANILIDELIALCEQVTTATISLISETIKEPAISPKTDVAAIDLTNMTLEELIALRERVTMAMWETDEWQEVEVPIGVYQVGVDIPAGYWTVKCHKSFDFARIDWGEILNADGHSIAWQGRNDTLNYIYNPDHKYYEEGDGPLEYSFEARDGEYIIVESGNVVFTPFAGKPDLGFK